MAPPPADRSGSPWLVVLTIGLAVVVLILVAVGLRAAAGRSATSDVVEVPARRDVVPTTDPSPSPSTTAPPSVPSTTVPAGGMATTVPKVDTTTPRVAVNDQDGRFQVTVPRTWLNVPTATADQNQWSLLTQLPDGELTQTAFIFAVRWGPSEGCTLEVCARQVVARVNASYPGATSTTAIETFGGTRTARIDATGGDQRVVAWVVVQGDRYWVAQLRGPAAGFDEMLAVVRPVVATMSFG